MPDKFQDKYRIPSTRAPFHDYSEGMYFVTVCTAGRENYFGEITYKDETSMSEPQMQLSEIGQFAYEQFANVQTHYLYAEIPLFVVMPNHIHAIVIINGGKIPNDKRRNVNQSQNNTTSQNDITEIWCCTDAVHHVSTDTQRSKQMTDICKMQGWLSVVVGGLKRAITHYANETSSPFAWQQRFHDRIIRNTDEMNRIAEYIEENVARWGTQDDDFLL